jgi:purine nucleosidase
MRSSKYKLLGMTTVQGIQSINESSTNLARYFSGAGLKVPTFIGASTPVEGGHLFPPSFDDRDRSDLIFNFPICDTNCINKIKNISAVDFLLSSSHKFSKKVATKTFPFVYFQLTILAIGPLTNIANAMQRDTGFASHIKEIIIMGGAVEVPGNVEGFNSSEWNFYADPLAAKLVLESDAPLRLVPLDVVEEITCDSSFLSSLSRLENSSLSFSGFLTSSHSFISIKGK